MTDLTRGGCEGGSSWSKVKRLRGFVGCAVVSTVLVWGGGPVLADAGLCGVALGARVVLSADALDPDVFVWDSRSRLLDYAAGHWPNAKQIVTHATLVDPGTLAVVVNCRPGEMHPKYDPAGEDVVGVRILTGRRRHLWGWVSSGDVHRLR